MSNFQKVLLIIMDGWGKELDKKRSAIAQAHTPTIDSFYTKYPNAELVTFGEEVGLPNGQMGNSEVGHMNIGAGRVVFQDFMRINNSIKDHSLQKNETLLQLFNYALQNNKPLHLMGLFSDGGVHSHINHLIAICQYAEEFGLPNVYVHAFTDGRDCAPNSGKEMVKYFEEKTQNCSAKIVSVIGRYYAMDRDKRWERIQLAYDMLVQGKGEVFDSALEAVTTSYANKITDEFIKPCLIRQNENTNIKDDDAVLCFNFRTDRCREITEVLTQKEFSEYKMKPLALHYTTMTKYSDSFNDIPVLFHKDDLKNTLGEVLAQNNATQFRIAETEKYPHVTFFFSGGREKTFQGEKRYVEPSPKVATYDLQPEMSAQAVKNKTIEEINNNTPDCIILNFANTDMVGHTGVFSAAMKAAETVDACVKELVEVALNKNYNILITADHGNSDIMLNEDGSVHTAHTKNLVPLFALNKENNLKVENGKLGDLAPSILHLIGLPIPKEMTGNVIVKK